MPFNLFGDPERSEMASGPDTTVYAELERQRDMLRQAQRIARIGSWELDLQTGSLTWSDEVYRIFGLEPGEIEPSYETFLEKVHPDDRDAVNAAYTRSLETQKPYRITHRLNARSGEESWVEEQCETEFAPDGSALISRGTVQDITRARAAGIALAKSEATLRSILDANTEAILVTGTDRRIRMFSHGAEDMFACTASDAIGQPAETYIPETGRAAFLEHFERVLAGAAGNIGGRTTQSLTAQRATGEEFPADLSLTLSEAGEETLVTLIIRDMSDRRSYEETLRLALQRAEAGNRAKSAFIANMSHELRTPLNGVLGMLSMVLGSDLPEQTRRQLGIARSCGEDLLQLLGDILDLSKIDAGRVEIGREPLDLRRIVTRAIDLHHPAASEKALALSCEFSDRLGETYLGDATALQQVLNNLVSNAVKFTGSGSVRIFADAETCEDGPDQVTIRVTDTGIGIADTDCEHIFGRFTQVDESSTRAHGGSGLGLAIVKGLIDAMNGEIELESEPGKGTTFTVSFPLACAV